MMELFHAAIQPINLPLTILVIAAVIYWLLMAVGIVDLNHFDTAFEGGGPLDAGADAHVEGADAHGAHAGDAGDGHAHGPGALQTLLSFLHIGDVPVTIVLTILLFFAWAFSIIANFAVNSSYNTLIGFLLYIPNFISCVVLTHFVTLPIKKLFVKLEHSANEKIPVVGQVVQVTTGEVTESFGQASLEHKGVPLLLQVRVTTDAALRRGDKALVIDYHKAKGIYTIIKYEEPKLED